MTVLALFVGLFIVICFLFFIGEMPGNLNLSNSEDRRFLEIFDPRSPYLKNNIEKDKLIAKDDSEEDTLVNKPMC